MSFAYPWVLMLLLLPAALIGWELTRRGPRVAVPVDHVAHARRRWTGRLLAFAGILPQLLLAIAIIVLAGPQKLSPPSDRRVLTNIEFVLDVSGSMSSTMTDGTKRSDAAVKAIQNFVNARKGDAFGLTIFGGEVVRWIPLTKDTTAIANAGSFLDPEALPHHLMATRIGHAARFTAQTLAQQEEGDRLMILVSDGYSSDLDGGNARQIGMELAADKIVLYMIQIGDEAAPQQMYELTEPTGGQVFNVRDPVALERVLQHIDKMTPVKIERTQPRPVDHFWPAAATLLAALGLHQLFAFGVRYTPW
jgi:Ca-activated chloride channel family protein